MESTKTKRTAEINIKTKTGSSIKIKFHQRSP